MKRAAPLLAVSLALSTLLVLRSDHPSGTLDGLYTDSTRGIYSGWLFLEHGWDVYRMTMGELAAIDGSPNAHTPWPQHPFIYPPGALLLYVPFGWAEYRLGVPEAATHRAAVILFVLLAHGSIVIFVRELAANPGPLALVAGALYVMVALQFALNGFHDPAYVAAATLGLAAARREEASRSLLWIAVAAFLHFRALYFLPVALVQVARVARDARRGELSTKAWLAAGTAVLLATASSWAFVATAGSLDDTAARNLAMEEDFGWGGVLVVGAVTIGAALYFVRAREKLTAASLLWSVALTLASPFSRAWHSLALYPFFCLAGADGRKREVLVLWILVVSGIAFRYFPNLRWLARGLGTVFG